MDRQEFFRQLTVLLLELPLYEREQAISYYREIIDDAIEDGKTEEEAVESLGDVNVLAEEIIAEHQAYKPKKQSAGHKTLVTVLVVLGFPVWGSLLLAAACLLLCAYILIYVPLICLGSMAFAFLAASLWAIIGTPFLIMAEGLGTGVIQLGTGIVVFGLSALSFVGFWQVKKGVKTSSKWLRNMSARLFSRLGAQA